MGRHPVEPVARHMPASLPDDLQDALSLGSVEARAGGTGLDVLEDVVGALARLAIEGGRAVVAQPVVVEVGAAAAGKRQDRKSGGEGKGGAVRVGLGGRRTIKKKKRKK